MLEQTITKSQAFPYAAKCWLTTIILSVLFLGVYGYAFGQEYLNEVLNYIDYSNLFYVIIIALVYTAFLTVPVFLMGMLFIWLFIETKYSKPLKIALSFLGILIGYVVSYTIFIGAWFYGLFHFADIPIFIYAAHASPWVFGLFLFYPTVPPSERRLNHSQAEDIMDDYIADEQKGKRLTIDKEILKQTKESLEDEYMDTFFTDDLIDPDEEEKKKKKS